MSYILDALNKSDRERQRLAPPALSSIHGRGRVRASGNGAFVRGALLSAAVLVTAAAGLWLARNLQFVDSAREPPAAVSLEAQSGAAIEPAAAAPRPAIEPALAAAPTEEPTAAPGELLEIWQLSDAEQRYLDQLDVTLHVFSTDPAQRTVIINGLRAREGQPLGQDLHLLEIVPDGLILEFQGQRVHLATVGRL